MVVYATGFDAMESYVAEICGSKIVDRVGKVGYRNDVLSFHYW